LIFSFEISLKKGSISADEKQFFFSRFYKIPLCFEWRLKSDTNNNQNEERSGFIVGNKLSQMVALKEYQEVRRDLLKLYPDARRVLDIFEIKAIKDGCYSYSDAS
jgi:hypothetical protein